MKFTDSAPISPIKIFKTTGEWCTHTSSLCIEDQELGSNGSARLVIGFMKKKILKQEA